MRLCDQVSYWRASEKEDSGWKQRTTKNETSLVLGGLEGNRQYVLTVKGFNSIGQGPASASVMAKTRKARKLNNMMEPRFFLGLMILFYFFPLRFFSSCAASRQPVVDSRGQQCVFKLGPS